MPDEEIGDTLSTDESTAEPTPTIDAAALQAAYREFIRIQREEDEKKYNEYTRQATYQSDLLAAFETFQADEEFVPGQLVQWKAMMKNRRMPAYSAPAIVVAMIDDPPRIDTDGETITELDDMILGFLDGEQSFLTFAFPHQRFTAWN